MSKFETGDIIVTNGGPTAHVLMCFSPGGDDEKTSFIHATNSLDFHISKQIKKNNDNALVYMVDDNYWHFRPINILDTDQHKLKDMATAIAKKAKYGLGRAARLEIGTSTFGSGAKMRLEKYRGRFSVVDKKIIITADDEKIIATVTCSEAIIICYQLTFDESSPYFINKDAAHTMPRTLAKYLTATPAAWQRIAAP